MSGSVVFYRFKAQKEASTVQFEGTGISVWDLKKEILAENKLGKGADFDFAVYNADTNEEYSDDKAIVPRNTSVIARRLPPSRPGRGNAQFYMASTSSLSSGTSAAGPSGMHASGRRGNLSKRFDGREDSHASTSTVQQPVVTGASATADEASKLAAFFGSTNEQWKSTQEQMSNATPVYYGGAGRGRGGGPRPPTHSAAPDKPVPPGYICYRCGQAGHWIQDCPTNDKPEFDNKPRIKRTTGIPKSFLQTVEAPSKEGEPAQAGVMISSDGTFVVARPDEGSWEKHRTVQANLTKNDVQNLRPTDPDLTCPLCNRLLRDAVKTPCCGTSYCEECIQNYLSENDFVCPECESKIKSLKNLVKDEDRRTRAKKYMEDTLKASKEAGSDSDGRKGDDDPAKADASGSANGDGDGPAEEGELAGDDQTAAAAGSGSSPANALGAQGRQGSSAPQHEQNGNMNMMMMPGGGGGGGGGNMMGMMNNGNGNYNMMFNNMGGGFQIPPQMQMLQGQIMQTMNVLSSSNNLPQPMRMQLVAQLQGLQYQYGQMMQMMQMNGQFAGPNNMMQQQMMMQMRQMAQMQQMQQQRMMMMQQQQQQGGNFNNNNNNQMMYAQQQQHSGGGGGQQQMNNGNAQQHAQKPTGRHSAQYEEDSADSPYMRVPINPKFRQGALKRDRPEDYVEVGHLPNKRA